MIDLAAVCWLILVLSAIFLPVWGNTHHGSNRLKCSSNLRQIGLAIKMYANEETRTQAYPRTRYVEGAPPVFFTGVNAQNPFAADGSQPNDITAAIFLILRTQDITTDVFVCPSSDEDKFEFDKGKTINDYSNFRNVHEFSYALANPYPAKGAIGKGFMWNDSTSADYPLMADRGPGTPNLLTLKPSDSARDQILGNSPIHDGDGQNVLFADGHVNWSTSGFVGIKNDNIYTIGNGTPANPTSLVGTPPDGDDAVLLPQWDQKSLGPTQPARPITFYLPSMEQVVEATAEPFLILTFTATFYVFLRKIFFPKRLRAQQSVTEWPSN